MSKATADVEQIRRFVNLGLVRSLDVVIRLIAITSILWFLNWKLALISLAFAPCSVLQSTLVLRKLRAMWLRVQEIMGESVTILQENLVGIHVVKAFAAEAYEQQKYDRKAQELREHYFQSERLQETNGAWMSLYFTCTLGVILWFGGWEVMHGHLTAGGLTQFVLYMNQLAFPIRQQRASSIACRGRSPPDSACLRCWMRNLQWQKNPRPKRWDGRAAMCALSMSPFAYDGAHTSPEAGDHRCRSRPDYCHPGRAGQRQEYDRQSLTPFLRCHRRADYHRWPGHPGFHLALLTAQCGHCAAGRLPLQCHHPRQHRLWRCPCVL